MEQAEQFAALIAGKTEHRDVNVRGVDNGYIISGQRRWIDPATSLAVAQLQSETIAEDHTVASHRIAQFLATGAYA